MQILNVEIPPTEKCENVRAKATKAPKRIPATAELKRSIKSMGLGTENDIWGGGLFGEEKNNHRSMRTAVWIAETANR